MEAEEGFKNAVAVLKELERKKENISDASILKAQEEAIQQIESQIERCFLALAARKQQLISFVNATASDQKKQKEVLDKQVNAAIDGCKKILETGTMLYAQHRGAALACWKGAQELTCGGHEATGIVVSFDSDLLSNIVSFGKVHIPEKQLEPTSEIIPSPPQNTQTKKERVTTLVGTSPGLEDGSADTARLNGPRGMCMSPNNKCLYVCDGYNNIVRVVTLQGGVSTFAAKKGNQQLCNPYGIAMNHKEDCFFVSSMLQHSIKKIDSKGTITTFAGTGKPGNRDNKEGLKASFHCPAGIAIDQQTGNIFVCDQNNHSIRKISAQGAVMTLAGTGQPGLMDGEGSIALFNFPTGITFVEKLQALVVCDTANNKLRKITLNGVVSTLCQVAEPTDVTMSQNGKLYVTTYSNSIVTFTQNEKKAWVKEGDSITNNFEGPHGIVIDESSNICYVSDVDNARICKIDLQ